MERCLVSKLLGSAENDNKMKLGELKIQRVKCPVAFNSTTAALLIKNGVECTVRVTGDGLIAESYADLSDISKCYTEFTIPQDSIKTLYFNDEDYNIYISDKYSLERLSTGSNAGVVINTEDLVSSTALTILDIISDSGYDVGIYGDIKYLRNCSLTQLHTSGLNPVKAKGNKIYGDIADLPRTLLELQIGSTGVYGDVLDLPTGITSINISNTDIFGTAANLGATVPICNDRYSISGTNITGSIEDLVAATVTAGKTHCESESGSTFSYGILGLLSFGGVSDSEVLTAAHKIGWGYGIIPSPSGQSFPTVTIADDTQDTKIWIRNQTASTSIKVKNFTQTDINNLTSAGWTVSVVN